VSLLNNGQPLETGSRLRQAGQSPWPSVASPSTVAYSASNMTGRAKAVLCLGACALVGRGIRAGLVEKTDPHVVATGRSPDGLAGVFARAGHERGKAPVLDVVHRAALTRPCAQWI